MASSVAVLIPPLPRKAPMFGVNVESALGLGAGDAGDLRQFGQHMVAQADEFGAELADALLRAGERRHGGLLHKAGRVRGRLRMQLAEVGRDGLRRQREAGREN